MSNFRKVLEFHKAFNSPVGVRYNISSEPVPKNVNRCMSNITTERRNLREKLIKEEYTEFDISTTDENMFKEMADLLYVIYGAFIEFGVDADKVFDAVHQSNMSKLGEDGKPIFREDGKVLKGPNYKPVDEHDFYKEEFNL